MATAPTIKSSAHLKRLLLPTGWPGQDIDLYAKRKNFKGNPNQEGLANYVIKCVLKRPGFAPLTDRHMPLNNDRGSSHLRLRIATSTLQPEATGRIKISLNDGRVNLFGTANKDGFLYLLESSPLAFGSAIEAEYVLTRKVAEVLSLLSLRKDVPLAIYQLQIECTTDGPTHIVSRIPSWQQDITTPIVMAAPAQLLFCAALYREASESPSPLYCFLCLYKMFTSIRSSRAEATKLGKLDAAQMRVISERERLPSSIEGVREWVAPIFNLRDASTEDFFGKRFLPREVAWGMKFGAVIEKYYRPKRNEIAHSFDEGDATSIDPDDLNAMLEIRLSLPLLKIIVRMMVANTFKGFLPIDGAPLKWQ